MKTKLFSCFAIMTFILSGCIAATGNSSVSVNNGKDTDATVKKEIQIASFNEIEASQGIKVIVSQGSYSGKVSVATTPSAEEFLQVKVNDGTLKVYYDNKSLDGKKIKGPSIITVTIPEVKEADLSSGAYMQLKGAFKSESSMEFDLISGSSVEIENLSCSDLSIDTSSGASANVGKFSGNLDADASSGSSISIGSAEGGNLKFEASSGASISAVSGNSSSINANASSGGSISLSGKTARFNQKASSGGSVNASGLSY